ncbi:holin [uncultured Microbacterium sp.]|uniref:holin n=1 Tax=uncultured Microbacterium sp. TaxID=191216 RepID=UPI0025F1EE1E|nr:holin [uncultured Microbacterium sp.]
MNLSLLASRVWWRSAGLRALYTALAIALPYVGGALIADIAWLTAASAAGLGFLASLATSLAGLPETEGVDLPWWLAAVERVVKTFAQALAAGFIGATVLSDVSWSTVIQAAAISALTSLLRLVLATLPADPTAVPFVQHNYFAASAESVPAGDPNRVRVDRSGRKHFEIPRGLPGVNAVESDRAFTDHIGDEDPNGRADA